MFSKVKPVSSVSSRFSLFKVSALSVFTSLLLAAGFLMGLLAPSPVQAAECPDTKWIELSVSDRFCLKSQVVGSAALYKQEDDGEGGCRTVAAEGEVTVSFNGETESGPSPLSFSFDAPTSVGNYSMSATGDAPLGDEADIEIYKPTKPSASPPGHATTCPKPRSQLRSA